LDGLAELLSRAAQLSGLVTNAEVDWFTTLTPYVEHGSYLAVFVVLILCGVGLPIPEEVTFIVAGYVVHRIQANVWIMMAFALCGILAGDSVTFALGRRIGARLLVRWPFNKVLTQNGLERSRLFFDRHGSKTVFIAGFMAGARAPTFFLCGSMGLAYSRFAFWDLARAVLTCPISIWLGYRFGQDAIEICHLYFRPIVAGLVLVVGFMVARWYIRHRREKHALVQNPGGSRTHRPGDSQET
jgi:membrane protein DedA with SNARE-associated domain